MTRQCVAILINKNTDNVVFLLYTVNVKFSVDEKISLRIRLDKFEILKDTLEKYEILLDKEKKNVK